MIEIFLVTISIIIIHRYILNKNFNKKIILYALVISIIQSISIGILGPYSIIPVVISDMMLLSILNVEDRRIYTLLYVFYGIIAVFITTVAAMGMNIKGDVWSNLDFPIYGLAFVISLTVLNIVYYVAGLIKERNKKLNSRIKMKDLL